MADHSGAAADVALGDRTVGRRRQRGVHVLGADVEAVDVVERAVVGLADDRQRPDARRSWRGPAPPASMSASRTTPTLWVFVIPIAPAQHPGLPDPLEPGELAVAVEPMRPGEDRLGPDVAIVRDDDGDAGADRTLRPAAAGPRRR